MHPQTIIRMLEGRRVGVLCTAACLVGFVLARFRRHTRQNKSTHQPFTYYISPCESSRVEATIDEHFSGLFRRLESPGDAAVDFVWIHTFTEDHTELRDRGCVVSSVCGIELLENKPDLAVLERSVAAPTLESHVIKGTQFRRWCRDRFSTGEAKLWIAKDANANGGDGLYTFSQDNWEAVSSKLGSGAEYVIQRYVERPLLWENQFKFHFRVYCVLTADMRFYSYRHAFAHVANKPFQLQSLNDNEVHLTNVAANIHNPELFHPYPVVDLPEEYPEVWSRLQVLFSGVIKSASRFMTYQRSRDHFMLIGADVLPDTDNGDSHLAESTVVVNYKLW